MSQLLRSLTNYIRAAADPEIHVVNATDWSEEDALTPTVEPVTGRAEIVDPTGVIDGVCVGEPQPGRLSCFMDGVQRQRVVMYHGIAPVVYGYVAAVIRERGRDRRMRTLDGFAASSEALYFDHSLVPASGLRTAGVATVDTGRPGKEPDEHPLMLLDAAAKKVGNVRDGLERDLTSRWLARFDGGESWLLVDGSLVGNYDAYESPNVIGVIKSHQTQYFPMEEQRKILALGVGERSGVFIPKGRNRPEVYSWYLRLRPNDGHDVYFGLIRVEAAKCDRNLAMVDEISRWLLAERCPLSLPDSRWDRMIYPIRDCEQYLKSTAPTPTVLESSMLGLGGR
jgi:hypothetical protein